MTIELIGIIALASLVLAGCAALWIRNAVGVPQFAIYIGILAVLVTLLVGGVHVAAGALTSEEAAPVGRPLSF